MSERRKYLDFRFIFQRLSVNVGRWEDADVECIYQKINMGPQNLQRWIKRRWSRHRNVNEIYNLPN